MKNLLICLLGFAAISFIGYLNITNVNPGYDSVISSDLTTSIYTIKTEYKQILQNGTQKLKSRTSTSFHIGGGYIVTCAHCIYFPTISIKTPFGRMSIPIKTYNYTYSINDEGIDLIGKIDDIALLYDNSLIGTPFIIFGDSDKLKTGNKLILVGNSNMMGINIKIGIVSIVELLSPMYGFPKRTTKESFVMTIPVNGGDSGGPVFVIKNNEYFVIGMCYAKSSSQGYNFAAKSNYIQICIKEIKNNAKLR